MKHHPTLIWTTFLLLFTCALTGVQRRVDAGAPAPATAAEPEKEVGDRAADVPEAPETGGCGAEAIGAPARTLAGPHPSYARETVTFAVRFKDEVSPYRLTSLFALPGEEIGIEAVPDSRPSRFEACSESGELTRRDDDEWTWRAPSRPGLYSLYVHDRDTGETLLLNAFVMVPYDGADRINGYRIGRYERVPLYGNPVYQMPRGMVEVTPDLLDVRLSPHFRLGQFVCKQESRYPKYAIVSERLLLKLESLLEKVNERGIAADTFAVLSGFRTPEYNRSIGNETRYSRHLYGDAADIYVDRDEDGQMDDLDGDGKSDAADARLLAGIVEESTAEAWYRPFVGGLGLYGPAPHHGAFIHVDTRGFQVRWSS